MRTIKLTMKALSHEGFGHPDFYKETITIPEDNEELIHQATVNFALKYGVEFDSIMATKIIYNT